MIQGQLLPRATQRSRQLSLPLYHGVLRVWSSGFQGNEMYRTDAVSSLVWPDSAAVFVAHREKKALNLSRKMLPWIQSCSFSLSLSLSLSLSYTHSHTLSLSLSLCISLSPSLSHTNSLITQEHMLATVTRLENATVRGRDWYKLLDAPVLTLDVTV